MSGIGTDPEETGDPVQDAWTEAFADPSRDTLDALVAAVERAVEARTREQVAREIETTAAASKASTLDRPRYERGGFINDWQWAARVARNGTEEQQ